MAYLMHTAIKCIRGKRLPEQGIKERSFLGDMNDKVIKVQSPIKQWRETAGESIDEILDLFLDPALEEDE